MIVVHLLPVARGNAILHTRTMRGFLLHGPRKVAAHTRGMPVGHRREDCSWDKHVSAWWVHEDFLDETTIAVERALHPHTVAYCDDCLAGDSCNRWDEDEIESAKYVIESVSVRPEDQQDQKNYDDFFADMEKRAREFFEQYQRVRANAQQTRPDDIAQAASVLGVKWPGPTHDEVIKAFRKKAMECHPDRGGTEEAMKKVLNARAVIDRAMGVPK